MAVPASFLVPGVIPHVRSTFAGQTRGPCNRDALYYITQCDRYSMILLICDAERVQGDDIVRGERADCGAEDGEGAAAGAVLRGVAPPRPILAALAHDAESRQHGRTDSIVQPLSIVAQDNRMNQMSGTPFRQFGHFWRFHVGLKGKISLLNMYNYTH